MRKQSGQVGLLMLVIMGVLVALSLSVATRSLSDVVTSRQDRESSAVFNVAETGIEQGLNDIFNNSVSPNELPIDSTGFATGTYQVLSSTAFQTTVNEGDIAQVDVAGWTGNMIIYWVDVNNPGENTLCNAVPYPASIEVILVKTNNTVEHQYYNTNDCHAVLNPSNNFSGSNPSLDANYRSMVSIPIASIDSVRIRPVYNNSTFRVFGSDLPDQFYIIQSQATGGDATSNIQVTRTKEYPAGIFDFAVFAASGDLVK